MHGLALLQSERLDRSTLGRLDRSSAYRLVFEIGSRDISLTERQFSYARRPLSWIGLDLVVFMGVNGASMSYHVLLAHR